MLREFGREYLTKLRSAFIGVPGRADYCVYWFRKAHDHLEAGGRGGLVGTNTVRQNYSRQGGLDYITESEGLISEAVSSQVWSGDAVVHVSIVSWVKKPNDADKTSAKRLFRQRGDSTDSPWDQFDLPRINSSLSPNVDVSSAVRLEAKLIPQRCFQGVTHGHAGFLLSAAAARKLLKGPHGDEIIHPYLTGEELISEYNAHPTRYIIDIGSAEDVLTARSFASVFELLQERVMPDIQTKSEEEFKASGKRVGPRQSHFRKWWKLWRSRPELVDRLKVIPRYIACSRITKRRIFEFVDSTIRPNDKLQVFAFPDDYSFGIIGSEAHWAWFVEKCTTLKADFNYNAESIFDTFPWPQNPTEEQIKAVADAAVALRKLRCEKMDQLKYSLRDLYRTLEQPGDNPLRDAHARLDAAVRDAYGMLNDTDSLAFLLDLNLKLAAKEKAGEKITPPGIPLRPDLGSSFVTCDCVEIGD